ncbi:HD domain-containing protein [Candidatus Bathyarchaeota archaeon]|nr:HD domain-containing protein [Candidatus Bathyarchaeota archaeon]
MRTIEEAILRFANRVGGTKRVIRTGWREKAKIKSPESIAEHMYRAAVISMVLSDLQMLDTEKVLRMCLLDDLPETITGDLTPSRKRRSGLADSRRREETALQQLLEPLPKHLKELYARIWIEAQSLRSREARLAKSADKLEMAIQALEYASQTHEPERLKQFITSAARRVKDPQAKRIIDLLRRRPKLISPV